VRRVLLLVWAAVVVAGVSCVDLTRPRSDGGTPSDSGLSDADAGTDQAQALDADHDVADASDLAPEAAMDVSPEVPRDTNPDVRSTLGDGLVGYWKLDEPASATVAVDSSGTGNNGQIMGSPARVTSGLPPLMFSDPGAFAFAGQSATDDGIQVPDSASLRPTSISIALWVKFASLSASSVCGAASSQLQYLIERRNTRGQQGMFEAVALVKQVDGTITFLLSTNSGIQDFATSMTALTAEDLGKWYHLVGTYDGAKMRLYVNGALERVTDHSTPIAYDPTRPLFIGRTGECSGPGEATWDARLNGTLDDIRVYNRALDAGEVSQLAAGQD